MKPDTQEARWPPPGSQIHDFTNAVIVRPAIGIAARMSRTHRPRVPDLIVRLWQVWDQILVAGGRRPGISDTVDTVSYTHLRAHETSAHL
eukprot:13613358-Alexandrium_andersonii.AAC.1